jgi:hypothetical protein
LVMLILVVLGHPVPTLAVRKEKSIKIRNLRDPGGWGAEW